MIRKHVQERLARKKAEGQLDMANRCDFCRRALPTTGAITRFGREGFYCSEDCVADAIDRDVQVHLMRAR